MSLRTKILLVLLALIVGYAGLNYGVQRAFIFPSFDALQSSLASTNLARVEGALEAVVQSLDANCKDTAHWDETYAFMQGKNPTYPEDNFPRLFYIEADFTIVMFVAPDGRILFGQAYDHESDSFVPLEELLPKPLAASDPLLHHEHLQSNLKGLLVTPRGPVAVSANAILKSNSEGPIAGTMILGRFLDSTKLADIRDKIEIDFALLQRDHVREHSDAAALRRLRASAGTDLHEAGGENLVSYRMIDDIYGEPAFLLRAEMPRAITALGLSATQLGVALVILAGALFLIAIWILLKWLILAPVSRLTCHISELRESGDLTRRIRLTRSDELGTLARQFDALTEELEDARQEMTRARDAALEMARLKSSFLATMSHEIRTPMNGMVGMSELLLGTELNEKQRRYAETIQRSADGLLSILNDVLDLSRLEAGKVELEVRDFGIRSLVEEMALLFAGSAHAKGLELVCSIPPDLDAICKGDANRLRQILINLIGNAIKFTKRGEVVIDVSVTQTSEELYSVRFEVRDTGIGISSENRAHIFDAFAQVDASTTRQFGGTGLGLAICRRLVGLMGGEIGFEGEPGRGSVFWLEVPLERSGMAGSVWKLAPTSLGGIRVLIAHDNRASAALLERQLSSWQMPCKAVGRGDDALDALREAVDLGEPYELVLLDMDMPDMRGSEVVRAIRDEARIADVLLVVLCSLTAQDNLDELDVQGRLIKPVLQSALFDCLSTVLGHAKERREAPAEHCEENGVAGGQRVLLVEDNAVNQEVVAAMLEDMGYRFDVVNNGQEALGAVAARHYDAVLMDCQMPVMDGYRATREIRRREAEERAGRRVPILALTASAVEGDREQCLEAGMDDYLCKPFRQRELREMLARCCVERADGGCTAPSDGTGRATAGGAVGPIDPTALDEIRALQSEKRPNLLADLIGSYLERTEELVADVREAIEDGACGALFEVAHALKSSSSNVGAHEIVSLCDRLGAISRAGELSRAKAVLDQLEAAHARARDALRAVIEG